MNFVLSGIDGKNAIQSDTITTQTYNLLRSAILTHDIRENEIYTQDYVSAMLNVGRTPVREALLALQKEGYIRFLRGRGFQVISVDEKELQAIFEARLIVEKAAAGLAADRATDMDLQVLNDNIKAQRMMSTEKDSKSFQKYLQLDDEFHQQILHASGNSKLSEITEEMRNQLVRTGYEILQFGEYGEEIYQEHSAICEAINARDCKRAESTMARHILNTQKRRQRGKGDS